MNKDHNKIIAEELKLGESQIATVAGFLNDGATVPFIARYRKEATGSLDEVMIISIRDRLNQLNDLDQRRKTILESLERNGHLDDALEARVKSVQTLSALEDIYLPYRPKRRTKGAMAREKGLEPLAELIFRQEGIIPMEAAVNFIDEEKKVGSVDEALLGARHIIAEWINENETARSRLRKLFEEKAEIYCTVAAEKENEGIKFKDYFDWKEPSKTAPSHRILAMRRGEKEDILNLNILPQEEAALSILHQLFITDDGPKSDQMVLAVKDSYKRLLSRSLETEIRVRTKERADAEAIRVFSENLRELLLASPLGAKRVMGIDPGFRTGCKVVCLDRQGKLIENTTIFPHTSKEQSKKAEKKIRSFCLKFKIEAIAIGNGTAGRETESFVKQLHLKDTIPIFLVNESGASIYSASETARNEFPDHDLTVRGSVSIGRRLMDPLAELVKIDPKSIGVGQYQHDVDQSSLKTALDDTVRSCVNNVGVDLNRASAQLLAYVSGIGNRLAENIVDYRDNNGPFDSRQALKKVPRLGPKAFEQSAGFLRIKDGSNPLDASAVHPESYSIVASMAKGMDCTVSDLISDKLLREKIDINKYVSENVGLPTLTDIMKELAKPGRDPREKFEAFSFGDVSTIDDLIPGVRLPGIVTNVTGFGAFVDIGVHQDGLIHISEMADYFVKNPAKIARVNQRVMVTVLNVDKVRNRISLSMKTHRPRNRKKNSASNDKSSHLKDKKRVNPPKNTPFNNPFIEAFKQPQGPPGSKKTGFSHKKR